MADIIQVIFNTDFFFTTIRVMTPVLYAAMACMVFYKGGVDAIGTEGIMLLCSLAGVLGGYFTGSAFLGVVIAFAAGAFFACLYTFVVLRLGSEAILAGIALNTLASGLTIFVLYYVTGEKGSTQSLNSPVCPSIDIPILKDIPILGDILSGHNILTYVAVLLVIVLFFLIYKTPTGLRIRTVGENPQAARSVGIHVRKYRYLTSIIAGGLAGMGAAVLGIVNNAPGTASPIPGLLAPFAFNDPMKVVLALVIAALGGALAGYVGSSIFKRIMKKPAQTQSV